MNRGFAGFQSARAAARFLRGSRDRRPRGRCLCTRQTREGRSRHRDENGQQPSSVHACLPVIPVRREYAVHASARDISRVGERARQPPSGLLSLSDDRAWWCIEVAAIGPIDRARRRCRCRGLLELLGLSETIWRGPPRTDRLLDGIAAGRQLDALGRLRLLASGRAADPSCAVDMLALALVTAAALGALLSNAVAGAALAAGQLCRRLEWFSRC